MKKDYTLFRRTTPAWVRLLLASGLSIGLMLADGRGDRLHVVRSGIGSVLGVVQQPLHATQHWFEDVFAHAYDVETLALDNQKLKEDNEVLAAQKAQLIQVEADNDALRNAVGLKAATRTPSVAAQVLYQVVDPYARKLILNKGSQDGIVAGQPVITAKGLLGQITDVTPITSELTLVLDTKISVPVQLQNDANVRGLISGDAVEGFLSLRFFSAEVPLKVDDVMVTSGKDGLYPAMLPVGRVSKIETAGEGTQSVLTVVPSAEGMSARYVLVLQIEDVHAMAQRGKEQGNQVSKNMVVDTLGSRVRAQARTKQNKTTSSVAAPPQGNK